MKRSLALMLVASLLGAPVVFAQPAPAPAKPGSQPVKKDAPAPEKPKGDEKKPGTEKGQPGADMQKAWEEAAKVGPSHKALEWFEGEWTAEVKDMTPGAESTDKGVMTTKLVYGGRFLAMDYDGRFHGKFFRGGGMMGYNNTDKHYESTWADSMGTAILFMTGSMSADGKVLTMQGEMTDPASGKKTSQKEVTTITGKDSYKSEFYMGPAKVMEISYTRGAEGKKGDKESKKEEKSEKKEDKKDEKSKGK